MGARAIAALLLGAACRAPPAPVSAADSLSLFRRTQQVAQVCLKVIALRDTLDSLRHQHRVDAAARLDPRVRDSLRALRWSTP